MLDAGGQQPRRIEGEARPLFIQRRHGNALSALDVVVDARHGEAALLIDRLAFATKDFGVDEDPEIAAIRAHVDHQHLLVNIDLGGRQTNSLGGVHRLGHVRYQAAGSIVDAIDPGGRNMQTRIWVMKDVENGHVCLLPEAIGRRIFKIARRIRSKPFNKQGITIPRLVVMPKLIIAFVLASAILVPTASWAQQEPTPVAHSDLQPDAPETYTVRPGDTLWGIASRFLKSPWRWPDVWQANRERISNPHLIYPGDSIRLDKSGPAPTLKLAEQAKPEDNIVRLSPRVRREALATAIPTIPGSAIGPFLTQPLVVEEAGLSQLPRIVGTEEDRVIVGAGTAVYVSGIPADGQRNWQIFRPGPALRDPDTGAILGYDAIHVGDATLRQHGSPSTLEIVRAMMEINVDDRLRPAPDLTQPSFSPRAPGKAVRGSIVSVRSGVSDFAQYAVVVLNLGSQDGIEPGHVLASVRRGHAVERYRAGRPSLAAELLGIRDEQIVPLVDWPHGFKPPFTKPAERLPDERNGIVLVFKTLDKLSYAMVMKSSRPLAVGDLVVTP